VEIHADEDCVKDGKPDISKIQPIVYAQSMYFDVGDVIGKAFADGKKYDK